MYVPKLASGNINSALLLGAYVIRRCGLRAVASEWEVYSITTAREQKAGFLCIEGLMHYAIERQFGFEAHQQERPPFQINPEWRNSRARELTRGIAAAYHFTDKAADAFVAASL